ncbi:thioredoxin family protein [Limnobacter sp.]|uniref:thioredoxin family protein n=1 Tax=Limnobacter sp. TaxID=2003368 RepID=UPI00258BF599|nr:thioredoxin family protein [Limnobacter sp.]HEX5485208.1 thioredoxin family protein [Limnobacter sp.]
MVLTITCLCADWCGLCRDFSSTFQHLAMEHPEHRFVWLDIEDSQIWQDEVDIETFPTLLITDDANNFRFFGPVLPGVKQLNRLLEEAQQAGFRAAPPAELQPFLPRLKAHVEHKAKTLQGNFMVSE